MHTPRAEASVHGHSRCVGVYRGECCLLRYQSTHHCLPLVQSAADKALPSASALDDITPKQEEEDTAPEQDGQVFTHDNHVPEQEQEVWTEDDKDASTQQR